MPQSDTIFATCSAPPGRRTLLRLSGPDAWPLTLSLLAHPPASPRPNHAYHANLKIAPLPALLLLFRAPRSFTGEDIAELHLPGCTPLATLLHEFLFAQNARPALPGEFSARAFFNRKLDLTQAEGIAATIAADDQQQLRAASLLRQGALHHWTHATAESLANLLALIEAGIDFSDEEGVSFISPQDIRTQLAALLARITQLTSSATRWERLGDLPTVVLTGPPNVGKSSLINALTRSQRAIVSPIPGTTRDALTAILHTPTGDIRLVDVAGEEPEDSTISVEMAAARRRALLDADLILHITAVDSPPPEHVDPAALIILNKSDLGTRPAFPENALRVSALTGHGLDALQQIMIQTLASRRAVATDHMTLNQRHRALLATASETLFHAHENATDNFVRHFPELLATDLRFTLDRLGEISGTIAPDEILGRIFSSFCIGK